MIDFAYLALETATKDEWKIGAVSPSADAHHLWHFWLPALIASNPGRMRMRPLDEVIAQRGPFVYPLELRWEILEWIASGLDRAFLMPHVPVSVLDAARDGRAVILVSYCHEARPMRFIESLSRKEICLYDRLYDFVRQTRLPPGAVWFINGNMRGGAEYRAWQSVQRINSAEAPPFEVRCADMFSYLTQSLWRLHAAGRDLNMSWERRPVGNHPSHIATLISRSSVNRPLADIYASAPTGRPQTMPEKLFLCMTGVVRPHRRIIVTFLQHLGLLDRSLVSYREGRPEIIRFEQPELQRAWELVQTKLPLTIDNSQLSENWSVGTETRFDKFFSLHKSKESWPFRETFINIVNETEFSEPVTFLTEKTWKAIIQGQPFIIVGPHGSLQYLRELGFQTFSDWIDESYDTIENDGERLAVIWQAIQKLATMTPDELVTAYRSMQPTTQHNALWLKNIVSSMEITLSELTHSFMGTVFTRWKNFDVNSIQ